MLYPVLDVRAFEPIETAAASSDRLRLSGAGAQAEGKETPDGFVVFAGSLASATATPAIPARLADLRTKLIQSGVLEEAGGTLRFTQDYVFASPSSAAGVLLGWSANGRLEWKDESGKTLREIQASSVALPVTS